MTTKKIKKTKKTKIVKINQKGGNYEILGPGYKKTCRAPRKMCNK